MRYSIIMRRVRERHWSDPVKDKQPREETLGVKGDFQEFTRVMRRVVKKADDPKPLPASHAPDAS